MKRIVFVACLLMATAMLVACGDQSSGTDGQPTVVSGSSGAVVSGTVVEMTNENRFMPDKLTIARGTTVSFSNVSSMPHNVVADPSKASKIAPSSIPEGVTPFTSPMLMGSESWSQMFEVPGEYVYFCQPHAVLGMVGTITVTE